VTRTISECNITSQHVCLECAYDLVRMECDRCASLADSDADGSLSLSDGDGNPKNNMLAIAERRSVVVELRSES
jgi:hypothetical protein